MRWSLLAWCFAILGSNLACADRAQSSVALYDKGDYAGAARAADSGLGSAPGDDGLWQMRIRAALALGDADGVASSYASYRAKAGGDDPELLQELAIATLRQALASPSAKLKLAAIDGVVGAELEPLADAVAERMGDDDDRVVAAAAIAILHADPRAPGVAGEMLRSENAEARRIAVDGIGHKVGKLALADLELAGKDADPRVRRTAIRWLGELKDGDAVPLLTRHLRDPDEATRAAAGQALARIGAGAGDLVALGRGALADPELAVRLAGIALLAAAKQAGQPALSQLLDDGDPLVAAEAAIALGGGPRAQPAIERAAAAPAWTTRAGAANLAIRALGKPAALALASRLTSDPSLGVRLAAARVLAHAGDVNAARGVLLAALKSAERPEQILDAATELVALHVDDGTAALDHAVRDRELSPLARADAVRAHATARCITPGLVAALADPDAVVRVEAAAALALLSKHS